MNKEIEKILEIKEDCDYKKLSIEAIMLLQECITNLQEELKSIKENYKIQLEYDKDLEKRFNSLLEAHKICDEETQEKQERIDKATGIANERINYCYQKNDKEQLESWEEIFDTLQGSDKE